MPESATSLQSGGHAEVASIDCIKMPPFLLGRMTSALWCPQVRMNGGYSYAHLQTLPATDVTAEADGRPTYVSA